MQIASFVFNEFLENTYVVWDDSGQALIIDPGCHDRSEQKVLESFITERHLQPVWVVNTHCHLDHVFGNYWATHNWNIPLAAHRDDLILLQSMTETAAFYGMTVDPSPMPQRWLAEGDQLEFGRSQLSVLHTPGHSPGSICLVAKDAFIIGGDVLFAGSIGRFDLPGGNYQQLMVSITEKLFALPLHLRVYSGHGPVTTLAEEKRSNPFVREFLAQKT